MTPAEHHDALVHIGLSAIAVHKAKAAYMAAQLAYRRTWKVGTPIADSIAASEAMREARDLMHAHEGQLDDLIEQYEEQA